MLRCAERRCAPNRDDSCALLVNDGRTSGNERFFTYTVEVARTRPGSSGQQIEMDRSDPFLTGYNFQPHSHLNWSCGFGFRAVPPQCGHFIAQTDTISTSYSVRI